MSDHIIDQQDIFNDSDYQYAEYLKEQSKWKRKDCVTCEKKNILIKPNETSCIDCRKLQNISQGKQLTSSLPNLNLTEMNSYLGIS
jgi:hypothetical protein